MLEEHQYLAVCALHKLALEMERGTASPRVEYEEAIACLPAMKAAIGWKGVY